MYAKAKFLLLDDAFTVFQAVSEFQWRLKELERSKDAKFSDIDVHDPLILG